MKSTAKKHFVQEDGLIHLGDKTITPERKKEIVKYQIAYQADHYRRFVIRYRVDTDADMIAYLEALPNASDFIKDAIVRERKRQTQIAAKKAASSAGK